MASAKLRCLPPQLTRLTSTNYKVGMCRAASPESLNSLYRYHLAMSIGSSEADDPAHVVADYQPIILHKKGFWLVLQDKL